MRTVGPQPSDAAWSPRGPQKHARATHRSGGGASPGCSALEEDVLALRDAIFDSLSRSNTFCRSTSMRRSAPHHAPTSRMCRQHTRMPFVRERRSRGWGGGVGSGPRCAELTFLELLLLLVPLQVRVRGRRLVVHARLHLRYLGLVDSIVSLPSVPQTAQSRRRHSVNTGAPPLQSAHPPGCCAPLAFSAA